jgi:hypothetical protein
MPAKKKTALTKIRKVQVTALVPATLLSDVRDIIASARQTVSRGVNAGGRNRCDTVERIDLVPMHPFSIRFS